MEKWSNDFTSYQTEDCERCYNTPCLCGFFYRNQPKESRLHIAANILGVGEDELKESVEVPSEHPEYIPPEDRWEKGEVYREKMLASEEIKELVEDKWESMSWREKMTALKYQDIPELVGKYWDEMEDTLKAQAAAYQAAVNLFEERWEELDYELVRCICGNRAMKLQESAFFGRKWNDLSLELKKLVYPESETAQMDAKTSYLIPFAGNVRKKWLKKSATR